MNWWLQMLQTQKTTRSSWVRGQPMARLRTYNHEPSQLMPIHEEEERHVPLHHLLGWGEPHGRSGALAGEALGLTRFQVCPRFHFWARLGARNYSEVCFSVPVCLYFSVNFSLLGLNCPVLFTRH